MRQDSKPGGLAEIWPGWFPRFGSGRWGGDGASEGRWSDRRIEEEIGLMIMDAYRCPEETTACSG